MAITLNSATTSHRDWKTEFQFTDCETGDLIDFTGAFIAIGVEGEHCHRHIYASTANGMITITGLGTFELLVPESCMKMLAGSYDIGGFYQLNGSTIDLFEGTLTVRRGIPRP